jgi:hypothetical protein
MGTSWWRRDFWYWLAVVLVAGLIGYMLVRTAQMDNQFQQLGSELGAKHAAATRVADYRYVADMYSKLYWPNEPRYVEAIPKENRVYILDSDTLKQFAGYKPGSK